MRSRFEKLRAVQLRAHHYLTSRTSSSISPARSVPCRHQSSHTQATGYLDNSEPVSLSQIQAVLNTDVQCGYHPGDGSQPSRTSRVAAQCTVRGPSGDRKHMTRFVVRRGGEAHYADPGPLAPASVGMSRWAA